MIRIDHMVHTKKTILVSAILLLALATSAYGQGRQGRGSTMKAGLVRTIISGPAYTIENADGSVSATNADPLTGNDVFFEYVLFNRLGLEARTGLTAATRNYQLDDSTGAVLTNVTESARPTTVGMNLYFAGHTGAGLKPFLGLGAGQVAVALEFSGGTLPVQTITQTVPLNTLKLGVDWVKENSGIRLEVVSQSGSIIDTSSIATYTQTVDYTGTVIGVALYAFF